MYLQMFKCCKLNQCKNVFAINNMVFININHLIVNQIIIGFYRTYIGYNITIKGILRGKLCKLIDYAVQCMNTFYEINSLG